MYIYLPRTLELDPDCLVYYHSCRPVRFQRIAYSYYRASREEKKVEKATPTAPF